MTVLTTFRAQINNWKALKDLHVESLLAQARELGATRYRIFRNTKNAADVFIVVESSTHDDALDVAQLFDIRLLSLVDKGSASHEIWEDMRWDDDDPVK